MNVSEEPLSRLLHRAQEIQDGVDPHGASTAEIESFIQAAEEVGVSRDAILQALRERIAEQDSRFQVGEWVYAGAGDGRYYLAKILERNDRRVKVRFSAGGEETVSMDQLQVFVNSPGTRIDVHLEGMWCAARIVGVNKDGGNVTVRYVGSTYTVPFEHARLPREKPVKTSSAGSVLWTVAVSTFAAGGAIGALITWLLTR